MIDTVSSAGAAVDGSKGSASSGGRAERGGTDFAALVDRISAGTSASNATRGSRGGVRGRPAGRPGPKDVDDDGEENGATGNAPGDFESGVVIPVWASNLVDAKSAVVDGLAIHGDSDAASVVPGQSTTEGKTGQAGAASLDGEAMSTRMPIRNAAANWGTRSEKAGGRAVDGDRPTQGSAVPSTGAEDAVADTAAQVIAQADSPLGDKSHAGEVPVGSLRTSMESARATSSRGADTGGSRNGRISRGQPQVDGAAQGNVPGADDTRSIEGDRAQHPTASSGLFERADASGTGATTPTDGKGVADKGGSGAERAGRFEIDRSVVAGIPRAGAGNPPAGGDSSGSKDFTSSRHQGESSQPAKPASALEGVQSGLTMRIEHAALGATSEAANRLVSSTSGSDSTAPAGPASARLIVDESDVTKQLVQAVRMQWRDGTGEARLMLRPDYLGEVTISLRVQDGGVTAHVSAEVPEVRAWVGEHQNLLRETLSEQGLHLNRLVVSDKPDDARSEGDKRRQQPTGNPAARRRSESAVFEIVA